MIYLISGIKVKKSLAPTIVAPSLNQCLFLKAFFCINEVRLRCKQNVIS